MPTDRDDLSARRSVVPQAAGRSLWLAAGWTGIGAALVCAVVSIVAVAVCWLPAAGPSGSAGSAIRAGLLTFLASLHAGITIDGLSAAFLPLGLTILAGVVAWRAGAGLADAANDLGEDDPCRLVRAGAVQAAGFALACGVAAGATTLGTSSVSVVGALFAGLVLFTITGGVAFARSTALADEIADRAPDWLAPATRIAAAATVVYLAAGAVLVAGSVLLHHAQVETLSGQVGGGWSGVPILLLGVLAAPNAAIAGASYLAGPGFAVGSGSGVALNSTLHGTLPAFPVLGALPSGHAPVVVWLLAIATPLVSGCCVAALARRPDSWGLRWRDAALGTVGIGLIGFVLAWQGGGSIGSGRLNAVGASPWQFGLVVAAEVGAAAALVLGVLAATDALHSGHDADDVETVTLRSVLATIKDSGRVDDDSTADTAGPDDAGKKGKLAG